MFPASLVVVVIVALYAVYGSVFAHPGKCVADEES
jgi:hypothetical protein